MSTLKEEILRTLNEMPQNYTFPPDATKEKKEEIKKKVHTNISDTLKRLDGFEDRVKKLLVVLDAEIKIEAEKIDDEGSLRYGPFQSIARIRNKFFEIIDAIEKARQKVSRSRK